MCRNVSPPCVWRLTRLPGAPKIYSLPLERQAVLSNNQRKTVEAVADHRSLDPASRLRLAREKRGLSQRQVAEATKLSVRQIEFLESGNLSSLPNGIYRRSIVKAVAREVGLDPDQVLSEFTIQHPDHLQAPPSVVMAEPKAANSFNKVLTLVSAVLPMLAGILYFALPMSRAMVAEPSRPATQQRRAGLARGEVVPVGGFADAPVVASRRVPVVVTLTISSRCQLRIVADGVEVVGRTMEQGETLPIELGDELLLLGDNAAAVQFSINGQAGRQLGDPGDVLSARIGRDDYQDFLVRY
jgi:cytoskeleton protein RodZ